MTAANYYTVPSRLDSSIAHSIGYKQSRDQDTPKRSPTQEGRSMMGYQRGQDSRLQRVLVLRSKHVHRQTAIAWNTGEDI